MCSVSLSSTREVIDLLKPAGDDCVAYIVSPDWPSGTLERLGFFEKAFRRCAGVNLLCNLAAGNVCKDEIRILLENGARVFASEFATFGFWALVADDIEPSESDPYGSMTYAMCGTLELRFLKTDHPGVAVVFDDPIHHREIIEAFKQLKKNYARNLNLADLE